jgi:hypothetical protein
MGKLFNSHSLFALLHQNYTLFGFIIHFTMTFPEAPNRFQKETWTPA